MQMNVHIQKKAAEIRDWPLVTWWIRATSPAPGSSASYGNPQWREEVTSLLFPFVLVQVLLTIPTNLGNPRNLIILIIVTCLDVGAIFLKRAGKLYIAGTIILITTEFGLCSAVFATGHLDTSHLPLLDLFLKSSIIAMAFFPPLTILLVTLFNCLFIIGVLQFQPHTLDLNQQLAKNFQSIITNPIVLQVFVAGVCFIIIRALLKEIRRADNAEEVAQLRQSEAELRRKEAEQAQQLEEGIQLILQALNTAAAKGDFSMRVPLAQENILWRVGYSINNLLARLQGFQHERIELEKTRSVANKLTESVRQGQPFPLTHWTGTSLDQLIVELNKQLHVPGKPIDQPSSHADSRHFR